MDIRSALAATAVLFVLLPSTVRAQDDDTGWSFESEFGASIFFGASQQNAVLAKGALARDAGTWEVGLDYGFDFGKATEPGEGSFVNKRSWSLGASADVLEESRISPFTFVEANGSLEKAIDLRLQAGAGATFRLVPRDRGRLDVSLAGLVDRTDPREEDRADAETTTVGRLSFRLRAGRELSDGRVRLSLVSFYQPNVATFDDYLVDVESSLTFQLSEMIGLRVSLVDKYDSLAEERGALANNDGRLFFSVITTLG
ncbi:MAG: DUF481 domain-containing protein [Longimicrobiales bacterium]|nr:DUF481 domain-containing protein [Longimicrobiales bacterium]